MEHVTEISWVCLLAASREMQMALMTETSLVHLMEMRSAQSMEMNWDQMMDNLKEIGLVELSAAMMVV